MSVRLRREVEAFRQIALRLHRCAATLRANGGWRLAIGERWMEFSERWGRIETEDGGWRALDWRLTETVRAERSAEGAKSKLSARLPFDFAAARLRSGRTVDGARRIKDGWSARDQGRMERE